MIIRHRAFILIPQEVPGACFTEYHLTHRRAAASQDTDAPAFDLPPVGSPYPASSLPALEAACWMRDNHPDRFPAFDLALYRAFFGATRDISDVQVLMAVAAEVMGAIPSALEGVLRKSALRAPVLSEHREAVARWGIRGIPAVMVDDGAPIVGAVPYDHYRAGVLAALDETPTEPPDEPPSGRILHSGTAYVS